MDLTVLHCCNHVLCVAKPAGLPVVPDASGDESLLDVARAWVKAEFRKPGDVFLGVVHRLDRPVSGVVCFGRTSKGAARLSESFRTGAAEKRYVAVAGGSPRHPAGSGSLAVEHWLRKDGDRNVVKIVPEGTAGARHAHSEVEVLGARTGGPLGQETLLGMSPITGRSHQLRVAAASLGAPLLGDLKYGAPGALPDRSVALHAWSLRVPHPTRDEVVAVQAPPPGQPWWSGWSPLARMLRGD